MEYFRVFWNIVHEESKNVVKNNIKIIIIVHQLYSFLYEQQKQ